MASHQLPLNLECWSSLALPRTKFHQPATNYQGRKTLRTPMLEAQIHVIPPHKKPIGSTLMRSLPVAPKFGAIGVV